MIKPPSQRDIERFWKHVDKANPSGCWNWIGLTNWRGYGRFKYYPRPCVGKHMAAHRVSYWLANGSWPESTDHLCLNKLCVNPAHLESVTARENQRRYIQAKSACIRGHAFTPANTLIRKSGARMCRTCARDLKRERRLKAKQQPLSQPK